MSKEHGGRRNRLTCHGPPGWQLVWLESNAVAMVNLVDLRVELHGLVPDGTTGDPFDFGIAELGGAIG
jgi:hypothetical protein